MDSFIIVYVGFQIIVLLSVLGILWRIKGWYAYTNTAASILTVIGVFGTFLGIFLGLQAFEINNIEGSIPNLLEGLKLAFLTSLVGIGSAILFKGVAAPLFQIFQKDKNPIEVERDKFISALKGIQTSGETNLLAQLVMLNTTVREEGNETRGVLNNIKTDLASIRTALTEEEGATLNQLCALTTTVSNKHNELISSQAEGRREIGKMLEVMKTDVTDVKKSLIGEDESTVFAQLQELTVTVSEKVGEIAAKVGGVATGRLIEALREVIRDFNTNLTEQFGENFQQLNEAVGKTVEWQEQYRQQMDQLAEEFRIAAQSVEQSRAALAAAVQSLMTIEDQSESLVSVAGRLDPILHTLNDQLEAFSALRQRAHEAFPLIEERLNTLTRDFSNVVQTTIENSNESIERQRTALANQSENLQETMGQIIQDFQALTRRFSGAVQTSISDSHESMNNQRQELTARFGELEDTMNTNNQRIQQVVDSIGHELDSVFERSANHITHVTTDFTQSLTQRLQNILEGQVQQLGNIVERNKEDVENHVNTLHRALREEVNTLNESLQQELANSLITLAGHIECLSTGFVNNYRQLVVPYTEVLTALQELVEASRRGLSK